MGLCGLPPAVRGCEGEGARVLSIFIFIFYQLIEVATGGGCTRSSEPSSLRGQPHAHQARPTSAVDAYVLVSNRSLLSLVSCLFLLLFPRPLIGRTPACLPAYPVHFPVGPARKVFGFFRFPPFLLHIYTYLYDQTSHEKPTHGYNAPRGLRSSQHNALCMYLNLHNSSRDSFRSCHGPLFVSWSRRFLFSLLLSPPPPARCHHVTPAHPPIMTFCKNSGGL